MQFTELALKLLLIFFPGIIAALIIDTLTVHRERDFKVFLLNSFILGLSCYFILYVVVDINNLIVKTINLVPTWEVFFLNSLIDDNASIDIKEVFITTLISIPLALIVTIGINKKILHRVAQKLRITNKFGQLDVWSYVFDSPDIEWIIVRDLKNDLMYQGWVAAFSDIHEKNELFIREVTVYRNSTSEELYYMEGIYIANQIDKLILEFPSVGEKNQQEASVDVENQTIK